MPRPIRKRSSLPMFEFKTARQLQSSRIMKEIKALRPPETTNSKPCSAEASASFRTLNLQNALLLNGKTSKTLKTARGALRRPLDHTAASKMDTHGILLNGPKLYMLSYVTTQGCWKPSLATGELELGMVPSNADLAWRPVPSLILLMLSRERPRVLGMSLDIPFKKSIGDCL